jgi:DNA adenine methylase
VIPKLKAPMPYFGGKSRVVSVIWGRLGDTPNYVEPFFGSGAVLLARPTSAKIETVNDMDGFLCNMWRALKADPKGLADMVDYPVSEQDLEARHYWLVTEGQGRLSQLLGDPDDYDLKAAAWWLWGACARIGSEWCKGDGPWAVGKTGAWVNIREEASLGNIGTHLIERFG